MKTIGATEQFSVGDRHGKFLFEEELTCEMKTYVCYSAVGLGVGSLVRHLQFLCHKPVVRKRLVKTSVNRLRKLVWSYCKFCKSARV
jgi:hypothetical protein